MRKAVIFCLLIAFSLVSNGQTFLGVRGGMHISAIDFDPNLPVVNRTFPDAGIVFIHSNLPYRGIQIELNYIRKGFIVDYDNGFVLERTYNFIEIPLLSRFYLRNQGTQIVINIGPNIGYHFDESGSGYKQDRFSRQRYFKPANKHDYTPYNVEYGILGGIGLFYEFDKSLVQAELRTYYGLTQFVSNDAFFDNRTFLYYLTLSYLFKL